MELHCRCGFRCSFHVLCAAQVAGIVKTYSKVLDSRVWCFDLFRLFGGAPWRSVSKQTQTLGHHFANMFKYEQAERRNEGKKEGRKKEGRKEGRKYRLLPAC